MQVPRHREANGWQLDATLVIVAFQRFSIRRARAGRVSTAIKAARLLKSRQTRYSFAMSGIEVAGLILGAFPLLLSALEKNREAYQVFGDWWKTRKTYRNCSKWVQAEQELFELHLRNFLAPVLADSAILDELLADPYGEQWRSESLADRLKDFLPTNFSSCISVMQDFHENMIALGRELGVDKQAFQRAMNVSLHLDTVVLRLLIYHGRQATRAQARS